MGKGFLKGTQKGLAFLPKVHTDFIFAGFAEEFGFLGSLLVIALFFLLFWRVTRLSKYIRDEFARLTAFGFATFIFIQACINILMTLNLTPVVGMPLPFMSYGGSSLVIALAMSGFIFNAFSRRED